MSEAYIKGITYYLPKDKLTNTDLNQLFPEWSISKVSKKTGINSRHIAARDETAGDMAIKAAQKLIDEYSVPLNDIDFLLFCTQSPDYPLPTTACLIHKKLGLSNSCGAMDYNLGCSGYIYGLAIAKSLIVSGMAKNVLLLTAETYTKYIDKSDKSNRSIFGDGASATWIADNGVCAIGEFCLGTDGNGANNLIVEHGGARMNYLDDTQRAKPKLFMDGSEVFSFTISVVPELIEKVLDKNKLDTGSINIYLLHQANKFILDTIRKICDIPEDKFYIDLSESGNTVSSTIPIALTGILGTQSIKVGSNILLAGFGVGYSWGATVLKF